MPVNDAALEALVIFASIAQGLDAGKEESELLGDVSKDVRFAYKENDVESFSDHKISAIVTKAAVEHFRNTFITYEGHYA